MYWFCHTLTWIRYGCTWVPHPEPPSHFPPHPIPLGHPITPAPSILYHALNLDWRFISHVIIYMFHCHRMLNFKPAFSLSSFTFIKRLFNASSLSAIRVSSAYLRLLLFLQGNLTPAVVHPTWHFTWYTLHIS